MLKPADGRGGGVGGVVVTRVRPLSSGRAVPVPCLINEVRTREEASPRCWAQKWGGSGVGALNSGGEAVGRLAPSSWRMPALTSRDGGEGR
jgi:hypothetical protein